MNDDLYYLNRFTGTDIVADSMRGVVEALKWNCASTQGANPTPDAPQTIYSTGDSGTLNVWTHKKNICFTDIANWEYGQYNAVTGAKEDYASRIRLKELLRVTPSTTYYCNLFPTTASYQFVIRAYDKNKVFLANKGAIANGGTVTTTADQYYFSITIYNNAAISTDFAAYTTLFNNGDIKPFICLNTETNKTYEPYNGSDTPITLPTGYVGGSLPNGVADTEALKKIGKAVLNGSEVYSANGEFSQNWTAWPSGTNTVAFYLGVRALKADIETIIRGRCDKFVEVARSSGGTGFSNNDQEGTTIGGTVALPTGTPYLGIRILKSRLATPDLAGFKTWLASNNVTVYYELATPVSITPTITKAPMYEGATTITTTNNVKASLTADVWGR